jgi:hypothetical protein
MIRQKSDKISKLGAILWELLSESGISQAVASRNMGQYENYLTNYIYKYKLDIFPRSFCYNFLSSLYHSTKRDKLNRNNAFIEILKKVIKKKLDVIKILIVPALDHHIAALTKIKNINFGETSILLESYIAEVAPNEKYNEYKSFLSEMDCEEESFDNLNNIRLKGDPLDKDRFTKNLEFENLVKSIKDFFYLCEQLRLIFVPNFYSPTDYQKIKINNIEEGTFLVKKNFVNKLNNSGKIGGSLNWNSGRFIFNENTLLENYPESLSKDILDGVKTIEKISGLPFRDILITKEQKKEIDDVMKKGEKIDLIEIDKLVYKYRGSYYLEMAFKNSSFMKESGLDFSENFEETRLEALSKELNRFVGLKTQEKTIPEEETFIDLVEDTFGYKDKEEKKIA